MIRLRECEEKMIKEIEDITSTNYEIKDGYITEDSLLIAIEDLKYEYEHIQDELKDLEKDVEENYKWVGNEWDRAEVEYEAWRDNQ